MRSDDKRKKTHKRHPSTIHTSLSITSTGNNIGDAGVSSFREMLVTYTTLTELYINCGKHWQISTIVQLWGLILSSHNRKGLNTWGKALESAQFLYHLTHVEDINDKIALSAKVRLEGKRNETWCTGVETRDDKNPSFWHHCASFITMISNTTENKHLMLKTHNHFIFSSSTHLMVNGTWSLKNWRKQAWVACFFCAFSSLLHLLSLGSLALHRVLGTP